MRKLILGLVVFFSFSSLSQDRCGDYLKLHISPQIDGLVNKVEMFIIVNDKLEPVYDYHIDSQLLIGQFIPYEDYYFVINDKYDFTITLGYEVIDMRDVSISGNIDIPRFIGDVLVFNFNKD